MWTITPRPHLLPSRGEGSKIAMTAVYSPVSAFTQGFTQRGEGRVSVISEKIYFKKQRGISIIIVIFLLAAVSAMALSMMNLSGTQHMSSLYTARGTQAYYAARAGLEYAVDQVVATGVCPANPGPIPGMTDFNVTIDNCTPAGPFNEGGPAYTIYRLTVTARSGSFQAPDVATRQVMATVKVP
jgi:MSHA biogenesis protein MshP